GVQGGEQSLGVGGGLAATHRAHSDQGFGGEVDPGVVVQVGAAQIVADRPALQDRNDRQIRAEVAQPEEGVDGAALVLGNRQAGAGGDERLAHPVLRGGPCQVADLVAVAADTGDVLPGGGAVVPGAVAGQLGEPARIQRPQCRGGGEGLVVA